MIAIIDYNAGNTTSVKNALVRLGQEVIVTDNKEIIRNVDKVIFPGVGEASSAMKYLRERELDKLIVSLQQPFLGICLGMQLMCAYSEEGNTDCLGVFPVQVKKFPPLGLVPHIGWNNLSPANNRLLNGINPEDDVYFVHSYYVEPNESSIAVCDYILPFCAAIHKDNFYAVQFHPEKSAAVGETILENFINIS